MGISEDLKVALCRKPCRGPITTSRLAHAGRHRGGSGEPRRCSVRLSRARTRRADTPPRGPVRFPPGRRRVGVQIESAAGTAIIRVLYDD